MKMLADMMRVLKKLKYNVLTERERVKNLMEKPNVQDKKGSKYYEDFEKNLRLTEYKNILKLREGAKNDLIDLFKTARENLNNVITAPPSTEMVNTIKLLSVSDSITPAEMKAYAEQMSSCPLAMKMLNQIAEKNHMNVIIPVPDSQSAVEAVDLLEGYFTYYITNFDGTQKFLPTMDMMDDYLKSDDEYVKEGLTQEQVMRGFWASFAQAGYPEMLDGLSSSDAKAEVQYYFAKVDGLIDFIKTKTEGFSGNEREAKIKEVLQNCPDSYAVAYRYYQATGKKLELQDDYVSEA